MVRRPSQESQGVYIVSKRLKGAFIFGVEDGNGVFLSRNETTGAWSEPAFFEMSSASFGLQAGAQSQEAVLLVISPKGVESILTSTVKLGVDGSVAVGPKGMGAEGSTAPNLSADFVTFPHSKGLYAGLSLAGAMIRTRDELHAAFYGEKVRPTDILVTQKVKHNQASKGLQATLTEAVAAK
jgi:lipid-binding SYLF domain-containing protein